MPLVTEAVAGFLVRCFGGSPALFRLASLASHLSMFALPTMAHHQKVYYGAVHIPLSILWEKGQDEGANSLTAFTNRRICLLRRGRYQKDDHGASRVEVRG